LDAVGEGMKKAIVSSVLLCSSIVVSPVVMAEEGQADTKLWSGEVGVSFISNNGNTSSQNLGVKARAVRDGKVWRNTYKLESLNEETDDIRSAEKYFGSAKFDRKFSEIDYVFGLIEHEDDRFSGYDYQTSITAGYGRKLIQSDAHKLEMEVGPGYRRSEIMGDNDVEEEGTLRGALNYDWVITTASSFRQEVSVEAGENSTISKSLSRFKSQLNGSLALVISYEAKHTSSVPVGTHKFDSTTFVLLDYSF